MPEQGQEEGEAEEPGFQEDSKVLRIDKFPSGHAVSEERVF